MARLDPFPGIRYAVGSGVLDDLVAPPYDVVSDDERVRLEARSRHNAVHVELPRDDGERDRYEVAAGLSAATSPVARAVAEMGFPARGDPPVMPASRLDAE